ncbi:MAG: FadR family transcriptional regulator [Microthrixaceae bacterium]|nr:FadR family transcriptional regulator [Microthrixaceae bacterium]
MNKTDRAVEALLAMIRSGRFSVGDRLPTEPELVAELGVSRSAVREAVQSLSFAGVLRVRQGGGTYVTDLEPARLLRSAAIALDLTSSATISELYAVRRILEPAATTMAVANLTDEHLETLRELLDEMRTASDAESFVQADIAFHDTVAQAAGNETLRALLAALRSESGLALIRRAREEENAEARSITEHEAILAALEVRDPELAQAATTLHLAAGQRWLDAAQSED